MRDAVRSVVRLLLTLLLWLVVLGANVALAIGNYLSIKSAFELQGYEMRPLGTDELLGSFFQVFFYRATLAHWSAMVMAFAVALGIFFVSSRLFGAFRILRERQLYLSLGDRASADQLLWILAFDVLTITVLAVPLWWAIVWDIEMFRFRTIAWAQGFDGPADAALLPRWPEQLSENGGFWVWQLADKGGWGYVAVTAVVAIGLERAGHAFGESWARVCASMEMLWLRIAGQEQLPASRLEGVVPESLAAQHESQDGRAREHSPARASTTEASASTHRASREAADCRLGDAVVVAPQEHPQRPAPVQPDENSVCCPVIGSADGEQISIREALANPARFWVDPENREIWDRAYRESLLEPRVEHDH